MEKQVMSHDEYAARFITIIHFFYLYISVGTPEVKAEHEIFATRRKRNDKGKESSRSYCPEQSFIQNQFKALNSHYCSSFLILSLICFLRECLQYA
ncbi:CLUMA_CG002416, isoform A [Clunio marinus]|uniref:CLUMA_CG002416, isoform A n=1 Tax=Clunio marinus TaxID=568069 RepID=A0A1J1HQ90_9DIPT|nr:CLUMA_CG002416, isoform A [Clunio marinus]